MFKIQGKDYSNYLEDIKFKFVRTYKGEINRVLTGAIAGFPASFITVGIDVAFKGSRAIIDEIEQLVLSDNLVSLQFSFNEANVYGSFSATANSSAELRDKSERSKTLSLSFVSDGTKMTKVGASGFTIKKGETTLTTTAGWASIYTVSGGASLNGATLPGGKLFVLGDTNLT